MAVLTTVRTMDDDYQLVMSPLCGNISRDGIMIEVQIYRGIGDDDWVLEVIDDEGGSTVWNQLFPTDQAARTEVMRVVDNEGIDSFLRDPSKRPNS